jgi:hypothetical protein
MPVRNRLEGHRDRRAGLAAHRTDGRLLHADDLGGMENGQRDPSGDLRTELGLIANQKH